MNEQANGTGYLIVRVTTAGGAIPLEGATVVADCVGTDPNVCTNACTCSARPLFLKLQQKIHAVLDETTIQELMEDHREQMRRMEYAKNLS